MDLGEDPIMCNTLVIEISDPSDPEQLWLPTYLMDVNTTPEGWLAGYVYRVSQTHHVSVCCIASGVGDLIPQGSLTN